MSKLDVLSWTGSKSSQTADAGNSLFVKEINKELMHELVNWQLARKRQGTHKAKTRSELEAEEKNLSVKKEQVMPDKVLSVLLY